MAMTVEELTNRLNEEALSRQMTAEDLFDAVVAQFSPVSDATERFVFAGMGSSGRSDLSARHKQIRDELLVAQRTSIE
jgi:hypothetical protein